MIDLVAPASTRRGSVIPTSTFEAWRAGVIQRGILPVVAVTGSRGKSTIVHLLDRMLLAAGFATATRTDHGVTIRGKRQRGEIGPWSAVLDELASGSLDIAIEEIDWHTLHALRLPPASYPLTIIANVCGNRDACLIQGEARLAMASLPHVFDAVASDGRLIVNGDDSEIAGEDVEHGRATTYVSLSGGSPALRAQLAAGEHAVWQDDGLLVASHHGMRMELCPVTEIPIAMGGRAGFQLQNALLAAAAALEMGLTPSEIATGLASSDPASISPAATFRVLDIDGVTVVVDQPNPSWFLRSVLRAVRGMDPNRIISVVGRLDPVPANDLQEVGRLLGRASTHLVMHSEELQPQRAALVRQGAALNHVPPVIVHTTTEGRSLARGLEIARRGDVLLVLADRPGPLGRALTRSINRSKTGATRLA